MPMAQLFDNDGGQAVKIPPEYRFADAPVIMQKVGSAIILVPQDKNWETFLRGVNHFSDDFMTEEWAKIQDKISE